MKHVLTNFCCIGNPFHAGGHNSAYSAYRLLNTHQKVNFWTDSSRLSVAKVISILKPLEPIDLAELMENQTWSNILRRMLAHACILIWSELFDQFDDEGISMVARNTAGEPTGDLLTESIRAAQLSAALLDVPRLYQRPGLLTIPITGIRDRNSRRNVRRHGTGRQLEIASAGDLAQADN
jgi:hypothetical protein